MCLLKIRIKNETNIWTDTCFKRKKERRRESDSDRERERNNATKKTF